MLIHPPNGLFDSLIQAFLFADLRRGESTELDMCTYVSMIQLAVSLIQDLFFDSFAFFRVISSFQNPPFSSTVSNLKFHISNRLAQRTGTRPPNLSSRPPRRASDGESHAPSPTRRLPSRGAPPSNTILYRMPLLPKCLVLPWGLLKKPLVLRGIAQNSVSTIPTRTCSVVSGRISSGHIRSYSAGVKNVSNRHPGV